MPSRKVFHAITWLVASLLLVTAAGSAAPFVGTPWPVPPRPGTYVPSPFQVPGKEYVDAANPAQDIRWDGMGGVINSFNYGGPVDAIANVGDALFYDVIANRSALLISVTGDPLGPIFYERTNGATGLWATRGQIDRDNPPTDVIGLEVWGPDFADDANVFSRPGEPGGVAVFNLDGSPRVFSGPLCASISLTYCDVDALMVYGTDLVFSIMPTGPYDGGEIWVYRAGVSNFLFHGGHLWDTAFNVSALYGEENIDAIEAVSTVPEPATLLLFGAGSLALARYARRRRR